MSGTRRKMTAEESAAYRADAGTRHQMSAAERAQYDATGEAGNPGVNPYPSGDPNAWLDDSPIELRGTAWDAVKTAANKAALGAGPPIAGAMGAIMHSATNPMQQGTTDADAYRAVRDETARELAESEKTGLGKIGGVAGTLATPVPVKALGRGAGALPHAGQGLKVGGAVGVLSSLANEPSDLTKADVGDWGPILKRAVASGLIGAGGGGLMGGVMGGLEPKLAAKAEEQALRAAGLRAGIKNSIKKDLGISNMDEARALGRQFLDEDLIPVVGSSEAVAKRAEKLSGEAGQTIGATLNQADVATMRQPTSAPGKTSAGRPSNVAPPTPGFDYDAMADAAGGVLDDSSAVADLLSGQKARNLSEALRAQAERTPGSFVGANRAKSDAWKSARFDDDAPMSAQLYRKAVGAARDDIERQVADALGPEAAANLAAANEKFGVAADALKLAENASTRDAAKKGLGMPEILALTTGAGAGAGSLAGHPVAGGLSGLGIALGAKALDKYGHSSAARFADFLAERAARNSGGVVGAEGANALAEYLGLLEAPRKLPERIPPWEEFVKEKKQ